MPIQQFSTFDHEATLEELAGVGKNRRFDDVIDDEEHVEIQVICRRGGEDIPLAKPSRAFYFGDRNLYDQEAKRFDQQQKASILNTDRFPRNLARFEELKRSCQRGFVIPFVGAGMSKSVGCPEWKGYLLGLCEGNDCKNGSAGVQPGKGCIQVFRWAAENWEHAGTIRLPKEVRYKDYSSLDFRNGSLTVISQASSAMWVGRLRALPAGLEDLFEDDGQLFLFPRDDKGRIMYCNLEGVAWLGNDRLAVVSDKGKANQSKRCAGTDQSIHIFRLPSG